MSTMMENAVKSEYLLLVEKGYDVANAFTVDRSFIWVDIHKKPLTEEDRAILLQNGYRRIPYKEACKIDSMLGVSKDLYTAALYCRN